MNILIIGSGGREHAFAWKIKQSPLAENIFVAPGNAGTAALAQNIDLDPNDFEKIGAFVLDNRIELVVVGPEDPLVRGIVDYFSTNQKLQQIRIIGPDENGAQLEGSKDFSKQFMADNHVPTAGSKTFTADNLAEGLAHIDKSEPPIVLKADGLAGGKGVIISEDKEEAKEVLHEMLVNQKFGKASSKVVIEEFLKGIEVSVFVLTDGENYTILPEAKDYKRIGEGDTGPNTGGMGAISPVVFADDAFMKKVEERVIKPTIAGIKKAGMNYCGFVFIGLMNVGGDPYVIEYNVRMGDPETQAVLPRIKTDVVKLLVAAADKKLNEIDIEISDNTAATVVMVSAGYPSSYEKGKKISGLESTKDAIVFHAGTKTENGDTQTNGGRVFGITGMGENIEAALKVAYTDVEKISWDGVNFRSDIGLDLMGY